MTQHKEPKSRPRRKRMSHMNQISCWLAILLLMLMMCVTACKKTQSSVALTEAAPPEIAGLTFAKTEDNTFAEQFVIYDYADGYRVLRLAADQSFLLVPEGKEIPEALPEEMTALTIPVSDIYLAGTAAMSLFDAIDGLDAIAFSSLEETDWYIENAARAMHEGQIAYAGKYREPDYEALLAGGCQLAVENTMILHTPEVKEKLQELSIPVLIDYSSYEEHPMGRVEWVRVYGTLTGKESAAEKFFDTQKQQYAALSGKLEQKSGETKAPTAAFFYVNRAGSVVVRKSDDYIPKMIALAGGTYVFPELNGTDPGSHSGSVTMSIEEFYAAAKDADVLLYNATIDEPLTSLAALTEKNAIFSELKAVKAGHVYTTTRSMYQETAATTQILQSLYQVFQDVAEETDSSASNASFFVRVE